MRRASSAVVRGENSSAIICGSPTTSVVSSPLTASLRHRFYKPLTNQGVNLWRSRMGQIHKAKEPWHYQRKTIDPKPAPENPVNNYYGKMRLFNVIPSKVGVVNKKAEDFGWPHRRPPPTGLRESPEFFPYFFSRYFPDVDCKLVVDSVLNNETTQPAFLVPQDMSKEEIANYLKNVYGMDNIVHVTTKNFSHRKYKNEVGTIKTIAGIKSAMVLLDAPVKVDFKAIKGTEDTPDNKPQPTS